jgi:hypothetical protein
MPRTRQRSSVFEDESTLFRSLLAVFTPAFVGAALITRAWALPATPDAGLDLATRMSAALPERTHLPPLTPITVLRPPEAAPASPERRSGAATRVARSSEPPDRTAVIATWAETVAEAIGPALSDEELRALDDVPGRETASLDEHGMRTASTGRNDGMITVGIVDSDGGDSAVEDRAVSTSDVPRRRTPGTGTGERAAEPLDVSDIIDANEARFTTCAEQVLKGNPNAVGRVELAWKVVDGRGRSVRVIDNFTGSQEMASCFTRQIEHIDFGEGSGSAARYTWVIQAD